MIDKTSQFFAILTAVGEAKHANAIAMGQDWMFTEMGLGDANGTDPIPDRLQTQLINEWRRAPINQIRVDPANPNTVITEQIIPPEVGGEWIREIGLYDVDGDLVAVANCAPSYKPLLDQGSGKTQVVRMNFIVSSSANIVLKIDPAVVLATREYVDLKIQEELAKLDHKQSARVAATAAITLSNLQTVDDVAVATGDRVLVTAQALAQDNGIYVASADSWTRAADADNSLEVTPGLFIHVEQGTNNGDSLWQLVTDAPINLGTTSLQFDMIAGGSGAGVGTFRSVTVDALGRVVAGTNPTTLDGYGITDALPVDGTAVAATQLETARTLSVSGAASGSVSFDGTANADIAITLADSGVAAGSYSTVSVNAQGLVTGGDQLTGDDLGLGTAAYLDAQTNLHDVTADALMKVGAFGLGGPAYMAGAVDIGDLNTVSALYYVGGATGAPDGELYEGWVRVSVITPGQYAFQELYGFNDQTLYRRALIAGVWDEWETVWDTSNFDPALYAALSAPAFVNGIQVSGHANLLNTANVGTDISIGGTAYAAGVLSYGNITANAGLYAGGGCYSGSGVAMFGTDGNSYGPIWGGYLSSWIAANYIAYWNLMSQIAAQPIGGVGTYGMFIVVKNINSGAIPPGTLVEGGYLGWSNAGGENYGAPGGTWMVCGGVSNSSAGNVFSTTICKRVA
ncbi:phage tail protein [Pseudomonas sp. URMO17WK12:I12]|uniref:phage tail-collar fiber domain-containing protein n=2 Tax=Pseudomonadota TaxID=1224 RepID=UPI0004BB806A